jgi:hypothetical protein
MIALLCITILKSIIDDAVCWVVHQSHQQHQAEASMMNVMPSSLMHDQLHVYLGVYAYVDVDGHATITLKLYHQLPLIPIHHCITQIEINNHKNKQTIVWRDIKEMTESYHEPKEYI